MSYRYTAISLINKYIFLVGRAGLCLGLTSSSVGLQHRVVNSAKAASYPSYTSSASASSSASSKSRSRDRIGSLSIVHEVAKDSTHLTLYGIEVPVYKFRGEDAELQCMYDRGTEPLYSVKWYKDDREFYRLVLLMFVIRRSNERKVLLKNLTFNSTGVYKCEVSADSPHFHTYENQSVMVVVELSEKDPSIHGSKTYYCVGDTARLNCTSSRSKPAAQLTWFINDEKEGTCQYRDQTQSIVFVSEPLDFTKEDILKDSSFIEFWYSDVRRALKEALIRAGVDEKATVVVVGDAVLQHPTVLHMLNTLILTGDVPNLLPPEDYSYLMECLVNIDNDNYLFFSKDATNSTPHERLLNYSRVPLLRSLRAHMVYVILYPSPEEFPVG
nr:cell adhesion molecule 3-like [Cherax quadricarinatus]